MKRGSLCLLAGLLLCGGLLSAQNVVINEFMVLNNKTLQDQDGDWSDWIELYNAEATAVSLQDWAISDNANKPAKWVFPEVEIPSGGYLVIFASGKDRREVPGELHTSFNLSGSGEYLGLIRPDGTVASAYAPSYPAQQTDISYGLYMGQATFMGQPTPGAANELGTLVLPPEISVKGGFKSEAFTVELSVADPSLRIYYTLNGDRPTVANAQRYDGPIRITTTTPLSAVTISPTVDTLTSAVVTQTYIFLKDVYQQPANPAGYPEYWSYNSTANPADYAMDPEICESAEYKDLMDSAMLSLPTVCIVTNPDHIFFHSTDAATGGIYINSTKSGDEWERPASVEWYDPKSGESFQINCGLRLHGGNSRKPGNSGKHSFRISFRSKYGASKLNFPIFEEKDATTRFDHLILRAGYNYTWIKNWEQYEIQRTQAQYIYDSFAKDVHLAMGHPATHSRFVHLYLNGLYWGMFDICEKINNDFAQAYMGGEDEDYDVVGDHSEIIDGTDAVYKKMFAAAKAVTSDRKDKNYQMLTDSAWLDLDNFIDYMLINYYIGNDDWDTNNWRVARSRVNPGKGFKHFVWDAETAKAFTDNIEINVTSKSGNPSQMMNALKKNPEFKILAADHIYKQFFNGGPLSEEGAAAIYQRLAEEINLAIISESARWGDYRKDLGETKYLYTRNDFWLPLYQELMQDFFPERTGIVLSQLKSYGLYPSNAEPPVFSRRPGVYQEVFKVGMSSENGTIYYTTDGSDPRTPYTAQVAATATAYSDSIEVDDKVSFKARVRNGTTWSALAEASYEIVVPPVPADTTSQQPSDSATWLSSPLQPAVESWYVAGSICYELPHEGRVAVSVYTVEGRQVAALAEQSKLAGRHNTPVLRLAPGVYVYRIRFEGRDYIGKFRQR